MKKPYYKELVSFLDASYASKNVYPPYSEIFNAFIHTPLDEVSVVIVGQDPYHGKNQAMGLAFSVNKGVTIPPSLRNIYKEITRDMELEPPSHGDLRGWSHQGVLLLNTVLTVEEGVPFSHRKKGWERFTCAVRDVILLQKRKVVFIAWGRAAEKFLSEVDTSYHALLVSGHPSPLSYRKFQGCSHFSTTNTILRSWSRNEIDWGAL